MKKIIPIVLCIFSLVSCSNATKNSSYYVAKNSTVNSTVEVDSNNKYHEYLASPLLDGGLTWTYTRTDM